MALSSLHRVGWMKYRMTFYDYLADFHGTMFCLMLHLYLTLLQLSTAIQLTAHSSLCLHVPYNNEAQHALRHYISIFHGSVVFCKNVVPVFIKLYMSLKLAMIMVDNKMVQIFDEVFFYFILKDENAYVTHSNKTRNKCYFS